jgi:hypothetical protein
MPYLAGFLTGVLFIILTVFIIDNVNVAGEPPSEPQKIVNWDMAAQKLRTAFGTVKEEVREDVHEATKDDAGP